MCPNKQKGNTRYWGIRVFRYGMVFIKCRSDFFVSFFQARFTLAYSLPGSGSYVTVTREDRATVEWKRAS